jgi:hypothetical protein
MDRFEYWLMLFSLYQAGAPGTSLKAHQTALHKSYGPTCLCLNLKKSPQILMERFLERFWVTFLVRLAITLASNSTNSSNQPQKLKNL